jgi:4-hydroxybenzoyl-CoA thioesterase
MSNSAIAIRRRLRSIPISSAEEWREKSFMMKHELRRGTELLAEGRDIRIFAIRHPEDPLRIKAIPVPEDIKRLCL